MTVRSAAALKRLYERYRTAPTLKTSGRKPGEWLVIEADDVDFAQAFGMAAGHDGAEALVRDLAPLNGAASIRHAMDLRLVAQRPAARSRKLWLRFTLVKRGGSTRGSKPTARDALPLPVAQLELDDQKVDVHQKVDVQKPAATTGGTTPGTDLGGSENDVEMVLPDGTPIPDLSDMLTMDELSELWRDGKLPDLITVESLFGDLVNLLPEVLEDEPEFDFGSMAERFRARAELGSGTPPVEPVGEHGDTWENVSRDVVSWIKTTVRSMRMTGATGQMLVLAPSPGTGKSRGMMEAADEEQGARRRVGYAVLSRAQLKETADRLRATNPHVRLFVIEGRNEQNCFYMEQVEVATAAGFSPGSTVCPKCPMYPAFGVPRRAMCDYYGVRKEAHDDRFFSGLQHRPPAIILTTHASAVQGSHIANRRLQKFWEFDTLFIDEDPTAAMVIEYQIVENVLTYSQLDHKGNPDGPTLGTRLIHEAMRRAMREREAAAERGFTAPDGSPDRIHSRDHGSSYAGGDLHALLEAIARSMNSTLRAIGSATIDGMSGAPPKGEIMNLSKEEVADRYPNRYLAPLFALLDEETTAIAEARAAGTNLEPAYRVHLDLVPVENGLKPVVHLHLLRGYANGRTNILIGDAYANTQHYEGLFDRCRRDGRVHELRKRAVWPTSSTLVRIVTRASARHIRNHTQLADHLEMNVRPVLELERGRHIVFYTHKSMRTDLGVWLLEKWLEEDATGLEEDPCETKDECVAREKKLAERLQAVGYAIEHWGSGRGKDIYRDFDTFIGVTEYVPNVGGMMHEANVIASLASPGNTRVAHWNGYSPRKGSAGLANSLGGASPYYQAVFHRTATDELAQAVHRIRPAIAAKDGRQKRAYVFGHSIPWSDELIAATAATAVVDNGKDDVDLETEALGRGARFGMTETLSLVSEREVAGAIAEVFRILECWSHAFAHALLSVPSWATVEDLVVHRSAVRSVERVSRALLRDISVSEAMPGSSLVDRVMNPPRSWSSTARRLVDASRVYRGGLTQFLAALPFPQPRRLRTSWMPQGSHGYEFYGDRDRFEQILNASYAPNAERIPF